MNRNNWTAIIVEDHPIVRQGLRTLLERQGCQVVAETGDGLEALQLIETHQPRLLLLDLSLKGLNGLEVLRQARRRARSMRVLVLSMYDDDAYVVEALRGGAMAYVLKGSPVEELVQALEALYQGRRYLSAPLSERLLAQAEAPQDLRDPYETLTDRERQILHLTAEGYTSREIAERLFISPRTVEKHRENLMAKLDIHSQAELIHYAVQRGLVQPRRP
ncbi:response regulator [Rhodothermus marinus]|uniref:Two component transcriptional regulator, LuxR family n=1 Tax=Rhodothermus marinus (strain ATCC 43812 / DSM 4252 / R-10) TaxID=518766 RepID=D0MF59_RHOM4|nr:response regulator transcription factor [Rhodothermus marinus]ACY49315.1 two component transcriptional regulator, LuxR family [Rhodothermus marinus DSM 4252]